MKAIKIIDLFAGIGGIRLGFEQAGNHNIECVFSSEWDKFAVQTYKANFNDEEIYGDITKIDAEDVPDHDVLLAGFPCQAFSQAGLKKGFDETRGTLFFDIERILDEKKPESFLLENVKHLRYHGKGKTLNIILSHCETAGYKIFCDTLKARDFGLPQNRERIYIVGFLNHDVEFEFPEPTGIKTKFGDILEKDVADKYTLSDRLWGGHKRRKREHKQKGYGFGYGLFNENSEYVNTLSARYYKDGSEILIAQNGKNPRRLTPRECARLQGFPEEFQIPVSDNQAYRQFGNSVPVPVIKAIAKNMLKFLK